MKELLLRYFPELSAAQIAQYEALVPLYEEWNAKINVISRKDLDNFGERHVLHSLAIAKAISFKPGTEIIDLGTGGGFPGIPLAIFFPEVSFHLVDSIGKKITVVQAIAEALQLTNVKASHSRIEAIDEQVDFVVTRAVAPLPDLQMWTRGKFSQNQFHHLRNGILALKGGDLKAEMAATKKKVKVWELPQFYSEDWYKEEKKLVHLPMV